MDINSSLNNSLFIPKKLKHLSDILMKDSRDIYECKL